MEDWTYGDTPKDPISSSNSDSSPVYEYKLKDQADSEYSSHQPRDAGLYTLRVIYPEADYTKATETTNFNIRKANQSAFSINEVNKKYLDQAFKLNTSGGSGSGLVTYSVAENNGVLSINGDKARIIGAGTVAVTATKARENNYNDITTTKQIIIKKAEKATIIFPTASGIIYGNKLSESNLTGGSNQSKPSCKG